MHRITDEIKRRRDYIMQRIAISNESKTREVKNLAAELFISERTIYRDIKAHEG